MALKSHRICDSSTDGTNTPIMKEFNSFAKLHGTQYRAQPPPRHTEVGSVSFRDSTRYIGLKFQRFVVIAFTQRHFQLVRQSTAVTHYL